jgi:hypothetical protein
VTNRCGFPLSSPKIYTTHHGGVVREVFAEAFFKKPEKPT